RAAPHDAEPVDAAACPGLERQSAHRRHRRARGHRVPTPACIILRSSGAGGAAPQNLGCDLTTTTLTLTTGFFLRRAFEPLQLVRRGSRFRVRVEAVPLTIYEPSQFVRRGSRLSERAEAGRPTTYAQERAIAAAQMS